MLMYTNLGRNVSFIWNWQERSLHDPYSTTYIGLYSFKYGRVTKYMYVKSLNWSNRPYIKTEFAHILNESAYYMIYELFHL
jgi:uncharacterized protein YlbG (UPF0298 family)